MKRILKIVSVLMLIGAVFLGYLGVTSIEKGQDNVFFMEDDIKVTFVEDNTSVTFKFSNTGESSKNINVHFGIKGDKNFDTEKDEIVIKINNFAVSNNTFDIKFYKDNFITGSEITKNGGSAGIAKITVGTNIVDISEYNYIHTVDIDGDGKDDGFNQGEKINLGLFVGTAVAAILGIILFVVSLRMKEGSFVQELPSRSFEELNDNNYEERNREEEPVYVPVEKMDEEEKEKYLDGMETIDMDKDDF